MKQRRSKQLMRGFTLIELVIVIVILGILAAVAIPKFSSVSGDARASAVRAAGASLQSANVAIYSAASIAGKTGASDTLTIASCGTTAVSLAYGYAASLGDLVKCVTINTTSDFTVSSNDLTKVGASGTCKVTYGASSSGAAPTYTVDVTGC